MRGEFLTVREVCERYRVSRATLWRRVRDGAICPVRVGRVLFDAAAVERLARRLGRVARSAK